MIPLTWLSVDLLPHGYHQTAARALRGVVNELRDVLVLLSKKTGHLKNPLLLCIVSVSVRAQPIFVPWVNVIL